MESLYSRIAGFSQRLAAALDNNDFELFLSACTSDFNYKITVYSPDIDKEMTWFDYPLPEIKSIFDSIPRHVRVIASYLRHISTISLTPSENGSVEAVASVMLLQTGLDGQTKLLAAGRYYDRIAVSGNELKLQNRLVRLQSRDMGPGPHVPL